MNGWEGDCYLDNETNTANFDGGFSMSGKVVGKDGKIHNVGYTISAKATADIDWETDDEPTGWNYKSDQPTYKSYTYATISDTKILDVKFTDDIEFLYDDDLLYLDQVLEYIEPYIIKQLLDPNIYRKLIGQIFQDKAENLEPPEIDYQEFD